MPVKWGNIILYKDEYFLGQHMNFQGGIQLPETHVRYFSSFPTFFSLFPFCSDASIQLHWTPLHSLNVLVTSMRFFLSPLLRIFYHRALRYISQVQFTLQRLSCSGRFRRLINRADMSESFLILLLPFSCAFNLFQIIQCCMLVFLLINWVFLI